MKFEIRRKPSGNIEVISFEVDSSNTGSHWKHWKAIGITAIASCVLTGFSITGFYYYGLGNLEIELKSKRETAVILRSKDGQERYGQGTDGATSTIHRTAEDTKRKN